MYKSSDLIIVSRYQTQQSVPMTVPSTQMMKVMPQSSTTATPMLRKPSPISGRHVMQPAASLLPQPQQLAAKKLSSHLLGKENSSAQVNCDTGARHHRHASTYADSHLKKHAAESVGKDMVANSSSTHGIKQLNSSRIAISNRKLNQPVKNQVDAKVDHSTSSNQVKVKRGVGMSKNMFYLDFNET